MLQLYTEMEQHINHEKQRLEHMVNHSHVYPGAVPSTVTDEYVSLSVCSLT